MDVCVFIIVFVHTWTYSFTVHLKFQQTIIWERCCRRLRKDRMTHREHETLAPCWFIGGPASQTVARHWISMVSMSSPRHAWLVCPYGSDFQCQELTSGQKRHAATADFQEQLWVLWPGPDFKLSGHHSCQGLTLNALNIFIKTMETKGFYSIRNHYKYLC